MAMEVEANPAALQRPGALRCDEGLRRRGVMWVSPPLHRATSEPAKFRDDALPMAGAATGRAVSAVAAPALQSDQFVCF